MPISAKCINRRLRDAVNDPNNGCLELREGLTVSPL